MMKRSVLLLAVIALVGFAVPSHAQAQTTLYVSGGAAIPTGDFGTYANTGWMAAAGVLFGIGESGLGVGGELFYGQNNHKSESSFFDNEKTTPYGAMAIVDYSFSTGGGIEPYVFGGAGVLIHKFSADNIESESNSAFGYQFGAGVAFPIGATTSLYGEGRYIGSSSTGEGTDAGNTTYFGVLAGIAFQLGS